MTNADLAILLLIAERPNVNGYALHRMVKERNYSAWAGLASTSIYNCLKKLEHRDLIVGCTDSDKTSRGPQGRIYAITTVGSEVLTAEVEKELATAPAGDHRFNLALCGLELLPKQTVVRCLSERSRLLDHKSAHLRETLETNRSEMPLSAVLLFERIVHAVVAERSWLAAAIDTVGNSEIAT